MHVSAMHLTSCGCVINNLNTGLLVRYSDPLSQRYRDLHQFDL